MSVMQIGKVVAATRWEVLTLYRLCGQTTRKGTPCHTVIWGERQTCHQHNLIDQPVLQLRDQVAL